MHDDVIEHAFVLLGDGESLWLDGSSGPIHEVNDSESLQLRDETVLDYIRFFFYFVRGDGGFVLIESPSDLDLPSVAAEGDARTDPDVLTLDQARGSAQALALRTGESPGEWLADATVAYQGALFVCSVAVRSDGTIEMVDDEPVGLLGEIEAPELASLQLQESTDDRDVTEAVVAVLLEDALREMNSGPAGNLLLSHFNSETQAARPIEQLTRMMSESEPIVIIESEIPFVEDFVAGLAAPGDAGDFIIRAGALQTDDSRCEISDVNERCRLYLLSFHTYRNLFDAERIAHELALSQATVLIGCNRASEVPEPLRRAADLTITFPQIDRRLFVRIFERVFGASPAADWNTPGSDWTRYLVPSDFHTPRRLTAGTGRCAVAAEGPRASQIGAGDTRYRPALERAPRLGRGTRIRRGPHRRCSFRTIGKDPVVRRRQRPLAHRGPGNREDDAGPRHCQGLRREVHCGQCGEVAVGRSARFAFERHAGGLCRGTPLRPGHSVH